MPHDVIMPALGMAQDTGLIVAWHRAAGDAVTSGDILMEVETDKATMEVEAGADGYIAELRAEAGENVPVGSVIAIISTDKPDADTLRKSSEVAAANKTTAPVREREETPEIEAPEPPPHPAPETVAAKPVPVPADGRVLASPKARRLAAEQNLDLTQLAMRGKPQPYHVSDLEALNSPPSSAFRARISAEVADTAFLAFSDLVESEIPGTSGGSAILVAFASASLRASGHGASITVLLDSPLENASASFSDPDLQPLSKLEASAGRLPPAIILRDLTATNITSFSVGGDIVPVISVASGNGSIRLDLDFSPGTLPQSTAIALLSGLAARLEEPLRQLL